MQIKSQLVKIKSNLPVSDDFIESELQKLGINPIRWAIVKVDCDILTVSVAYQDL